MFTHFFIDRPILSAVISILFVLGGAVAMWVSPIAQYPELAPPQVTVEARYPGATAEVIANMVAAPLEAQINGIDNLLYFNSVSSSSGNLSLSVVFNPASDPDINQVNVQNRVSQAMSQLPQTVVQQGITVEKKSSSIMMVVSVFIGSFLKNLILNRSQRDNEVCMKASFPWFSSVEKFKARGRKPPISSGRSACAFSQSCVQAAQSRAGFAAANHVWESNPFCQ